MADLVDKYNCNLDDIDEVFKVSNLIRDIVTKNLEKIDSSQIRADYAQIIRNTIQSIGSISDKSLENAEKPKDEKLYSLGIVMIVSLAEELLKDLFEKLVYENIEHISCILNKDINLPLRAISDLNFTLSKDDWVKLVLDYQIYQQANPSQKINLQNIKSIEGMFKDYFGIIIQIEDIIRQRIHFYYQIRHLILHNNSKIDKRFLDNISKAGNDITDYKVGEKITISENEYVECKELFKNLFCSIEIATGECNGTT